MAELVWAKKNFRLIVMIASDNKVFWIELNQSKCPYPWDQYISLQQESSIIILSADTKHYIALPMNSFLIRHLSWRSSSQETRMQLTKAISVVLYATSSVVLSSVTSRLNRYLSFFIVWQTGRNGWEYCRHHALRTLHSLYTEDIVHTLHWQHYTHFTLKTLWRLYTGDITRTLHWGHYAQYTLITLHTWYTEGITQTIHRWYYIHCTLRTLLILYTEDIMHTLQ